MKVKLWIKIPYSSVLIFVLGAQKNRLIETVLLSTHNTCFGWELRKVFLIYPFLCRGLMVHVGCILSFLLNVNEIFFSADWQWLARGPGHAQTRLYIQKGFLCIFTASSSSLARSSTRVVHASSPSTTSVCLPWYASISWLWNASGSGCFSSKYISLPHQAPWPGLPLDWSMPPPQHHLSLPSLECQHILVMECLQVRALLQ